MKTLETLLTGNQDHNYCVVDEVSRLMKKGYACYLEYEIFIGPTDLYSTCKTKRGYRAAVDVYAMRGNEEVIIEVGTLSLTHGYEDRIALLKHLRPKAKIIHVHQWKNYGINGSLMRMLWYEWKERNYLLAIKKFQNGTLGHEWNFGECLKYPKFLEGIECQKSEQKELTF